MVAHLAKPVAVELLVATLLQACGHSASSAGAAGKDAAALGKASWTSVEATGSSSTTTTASSQAAGQSAEKTAPTIDWNAMVRQLGASEDFLRRLARTLVSSLGPRAAALRDAATAGDLPALAREAHTVKGVAANVAASRAQALAAAVEQAARVGRVEALADAHALADEVERMLEAARKRT
jgi:HPt (histidine-containing phosphotransfer) domain-containing protein